MVVLNAARQKKKQGQLVTLVILVSKVLAMRKNQDDELQFVVLVQKLTQGNQKKKIQVAWKKNLLPWKLHSETTASSSLFFARQAPPSSLNKLLPKP